MELPYVTVVMPIFNKRQYVENSLESVLSQNYKNFEVVVVDDGSSDGSKELVISAFGEKIRFFEQENAGPGAARNKGIAEAKFDLVAFIDADDIWTPQHLQELVFLYFKDPEGGLFSTRGKKLMDSDCSNFRGDVSSHWRYVDYVNDLAEGKVVVHTSSVMIRKRVFYEVGNFKNFRPGQDIDMWLRVFLKYPVLQSESVTSCHRLGTGGIMEQSDLFGLKNTHSKPESIEDVNPLLASIFAIRENYSLGSREYNQLSKLMNANLLKIIRVLLVNGEEDKAKKLVGFFVCPGSGKVVFFKYIFRLPGGFPSFLVNCFRKTKSLLGWLRV